MSTIFFPIIELVDRLVIAELKFEKTQANLSELEWYRAQAQQYNFSLIQQELDNLKSIHSAIWQLESDLKSSREHLHTLEEIGRRAIEIRNLNNLRIQLKNSMAEKLNCPVREVKTDHLSE